MKGDAQEEEAELDFFGITSADTPELTHPQEEEEDQLGIDSDDTEDGKLTCTSKPRCALTCILLVGVCVLS